MTTPDENVTPEGTAPVPEATPAGVPEPLAAPVAPAGYAATPAPAQYTPAAPPAYAPAPNQYPHTWMNIVAFVTGLLGFGIIPVIFGHLGVNRANKGTADFKWMGIVGLVLGYLTIVFGLIFAAIFIGAIIASDSTSY